MKKLRLAAYPMFALFWIVSGIVGWSSVPSVYVLACFGCAIFNLSVFTELLQEILDERD